METRIPFDPWPVRPVPVDPDPEHFELLDMAALLLSEITDPEFQALMLSGVANG
jgi:hypothetical protein